MFTKPENLPVFESHAQRIALDYIEPKLQNVRIINKKAFIEVDCEVWSIKDNMYDIENFYKKLGWKSVTFEFYDGI